MYNDISRHTIFRFCMKQYSSDMRTFSLDLSVFLCKVTFFKSYSSIENLAVVGGTPNATHPTTKVDSLVQFVCYCVHNWNTLLRVTGATG